MDKNGTENVPDVTKLSTIDVDNYHGLTSKTILAYSAIWLISVAQLMNVVGGGAYATNIAAAVGGSTKTIWLTQVIVITTAVLGPIVSQAADYWGRKYLLVCLTACGFIGSMIVSRATSMSMAIAGECVCGLSYGAQPMLFAIPSEILPRRYRPAAQGGTTIANGIGGILGLLVGGTLVKNYTEGFRIYYYIVAALFAVCTIGAALLYNPPVRELQTSLKFKQKLEQLDWVAYGLLASGTVCLCLALSWAENPYSWKSAHVLGPLLVGAALLVALAAHQAWFKKDGLIHHRLFENDRNFALALFVIFMDGIAFFAANNYFAYEVGVLFETDPIRIGLRFCIVFFAGILSCLFISAYSSIRKTLRLPIVVSFMFYIVFYALMASVKLSSSTAMWIYPILLGLGLGLSLTCLITVAQLSPPPDLISTTSGLLISIRSLGASIALGIFNAIFNSQLNKHLVPDIAAAVLPLGLPASSLPAFISDITSEDFAALARIPGVTPEIIGAGTRGLQDGFLLAFRGVWICAAVLSFIGTISACFFVKPNHLNMHVDAPLEEEKP